MAAPQRSKRIQALNQSNEGSIRVDESLEASKKEHRDKRRKMAESQGRMSEGHSQEQAPGEQAPEEKAPEEQAPEEQAPGEQPPQKQALEPTAEYIEQKEREYDEQRQKLNRSKAYLHTHLALPRLDGFVEKNWKRLSGSIHGFVNVPSLNDITWDSLDGDLQQKFISYAPNAEELFEPWAMNGRVFQRWVWEIIDENFFSHKSKDIVWESPYWEAQATMERYLRDQPNPTDHDFPYDKEYASYKFLHWRYTTMDFYRSLKGSPPQWRSLRRIDPTCVVPIIAKALGRYFPQEYDERDPMNGASPVLPTLSNDVAEMEFFFDANLAVFSHVFHHPDSTNLRGGLSRNEEGQNVDLVVSPMLLQRGHHHGYDYHVKKAVHPMEVCVAWLDAHRNQPDSPEANGKEEHSEETDGAATEEKSEEHDEDDSEDKDGKEEGNEVEELTKEGEESRQEVDKDEDDKDKDKEYKGIIEEGGKNNRNKERADNEVKDEGEGEGKQEGDPTSQEEKEINIKGTAKSKKKKKGKGKRCR
ncbi:hypothetical protein F25303_10381 [Fusarium sp. NRRL 25303]|nr:hypothetical protein F25303_10381 [Fusarium sp. NRRL 25303]